MSRVYYNRKNQQFTVHPTIYCYDKDGNFICSEIGYNQMAKKLGVPQGGIYDCCKKIKDPYTTHRTAYGYVFALVELTPEQVKKRYESYKKKFDYIYWYDCEGNLLANYTGYDEAAFATDIPRTRISNCCHNVTKTTSETTFSFTKLSEEQIKQRFNTKDKYTKNYKLELYNVKKRTEEYL